MKIIAVLFLSVALASAAFTGSSLLQQARPLLNKASIDTKIALSGPATFRNRNAGSQLQNQLVNTLQSQAETLISQIQNTIQAGQEIAQNLVSQFHDTLQQLQSLGPQIIQHGQGILQNMVNNLLGSLSVGANPKFVEARQLIGNFNLPELLQQALQQTLENSPTTDEINTLISQLAPIPGTGNLIDQLTQMMLLAAKPQTRGIVSGISDFGFILSQLFQVVGNTAGNSYVAVSSLIEQFFGAVIQTGSNTVEAAAQLLLNFLWPFQWALGAVYDQVVEIVNNIVGSNKVF